MGINTSNLNIKTKTYEDLLAQRNMDVPDIKSNIPKTPPFSVATQKKKHDIPKASVNNSFLSSQTEEIDVASNRMKGDTYYLSGNNLDSNFGSVNFQNNELSSGLPTIDESISVEDRLKKLQFERSKLMKL